MKALVVSIRTPFHDERVLNPYRLSAWVAVIAITNALSLYVTVPLNAIFHQQKTLDVYLEFNIKIGEIIKPSNVKLHKFNNNSNF